MYVDKFDGLVRAEFEFGNEDEAKSFIPPNWVGREITETDLGRDGKLVQITRGVFLKMLNNYK